MINPTDDPGRELVLVGGSSPADVALVHREALRVLRSTIDTAHLDAYSDDAWPPEVRHAYERAVPGPGGGGGRRSLPARRSRDGDRY
ncbi:hypothetical protein [Streptomyces sp. NPDC056291]|uniref:hypothetical protein n=1 Tax=Streptomyces sp. NPDC056291 TaxID=3345772 RepID=UPI0035D801F2